MKTRINIVRATLERCNGMIGGQRGDDTCGDRRFPGTAVWSGNYKAWDVRQMPLNSCHQ